jgi:large subunit ribosomal protein L25
MRNFEVKPRSNRENEEVKVIVYAKGFNSQGEINRKELMKELHTTNNIFSKIFKFKVENKELFGIFKEIQLHPITESVVHVDIMVINENTKFQIPAKVQVEGANTCQAIKEGGILFLPKKTVNIICNSIEDAVDHIVVNVSNLQKGHTITTGDLNLKNISFEKNNIALVSILKE